MSKGGVIFVWIVCWIPFSFVMLTAVSVLMIGVGLVIGPGLQESQLFWRAIVMPICAILAGCCAAQVARPFWPH